VIVRSLIEQHLPEFSSSDTRIARLILEKYPVSALGGIEDIARQSEVSAPTVTRFVKRLGFQKFADFQRAIRLEVQDTEASPLALFKKHQGKVKRPTHADRLMAEHMALAMQKLLDAPTQRALDKAADLVSDEKVRVFMLGGRFSSAAAQYAAFQLISLRGEVHALTPQAAGLREDHIADFTRKDVLVAFDFRRYQAETIAFCQVAKSKGVRIALFTDLDLSPISDIADVVVPVSVDIASPIDTLSVAIVATDALLLRVAKKLGPRATKRMAMLETLRRRATDPNLH
jgi:DNA-binding MurR/RpiR family transcriptional regulator